MAVLDMSYLSYTLHRYVPCKVILPLENTKAIDPDFSTAPEKFRTLYLLHGYSGNEGDWIYGTEIFKIARDEHLAVVMPAGENSFYVNDKLRNYNMATFVGEELVKATRRLFPLSERREDTFIGGLSMGGFGSMYLGRKYADTFSKVICLSGIYDPEDPVMKVLLKQQMGFSDAYMASLFPQEEMNYLDPHTQVQEQSYFLGCGRQDPLYAGGKAAYEKFKAAGRDVTWYEEDGAHDFVFWNHGIRKGIEWISH